MKAQDFERFQNPIKIELGKIDALHCGRNENRVELEFTLFTGRNAHRERGDEYCTWNVYVYNRLGKKFLFSTDCPEYHRKSLEICGLHPAYMEHLKTLRNTYLKNGLKYTRLLPTTDVAKMIDCVLEIEKIAEKYKKVVRKFGYLK